MIKTEQLNEAVAAGCNGVAQGDTGQQLFRVIYEELRQIAGQFMLHENGCTLQPTALVTEVWLKLFHNRPDVRFDSRGHFFVVVSNAMRQILVDSARARNAKKRGGDLNRNQFTVDCALLPDDKQLLELDDALRALESVAPEKSQLVKLRFFGGLTLEECAKALNVSPATASRYWKFAKAWLKRHMDQT